MKIQPCSRLALIVITASISLPCALCTGSEIVTDGVLGGEPPAFRMNMGAVFSEDEEAADHLAGSVSGFLRAVVGGEGLEGYVTPEDQREHAFFFRALRNLGAPDGKLERSPLILKSFSPDGGESYLITVAFMRAGEDGDSVYRVIEFHAYPYDGGYRYKSPFVYNTRALRVRSIGSVRFHLSKALDESRAREFVEFKSMFEGLVGNPEAPLDYYCFETLDELLRAHGIVYDCTRCNWLKEDLGFLDNNGGAFITGSGDERYIFEYLVDYMAERCDEDSDLYPPFVYGIATYFGDYGLSRDDMRTLKSQFRAELREKPGIDFLAEFKKGRGSSVSRHFSCYVMSAFLCEEIVEQHGLEAMIRLAHAGRDGERFFLLLEELLGVGEGGFHALIERLIRGDG